MVTEGACGKVSHIFKKVSLSKVADLSWEVQGGQLYRAFAFRVQAVALKHHAGKFKSEFKLSFCGDNSELFLLILWR
jgi:hypothetical protein